MKRRFNNLSIYRILVTVGIIVFHFFYYTTNPRDQISQLLALQVAGLTALSGFLLSQKEITDTKKFYKDYFFKILIPILTAVGIIFVLDCIGAVFVKPNSFFELFFINQLHYEGPIIQFGNLWYIPYILVCYLITPLLKKKTKISTVLIVVGFLIAEYFVYYFGHVRLQVLPFLVGYFIGTIKFERYTTFSKHSISRIVVWCSLVAISIFIRFHNFEGVLNEIKGIWHPFNDSLIGVSSFFAFISIFSFLNTTKKVRLLSFTDKISYHIYICTLVFYGGVLSIINKNIMYELQLVIILLLTIALSLINYYVNTVFSVFKQKNNRKKVSA